VRANSTSNWEEIFLFFSQTDFVNKRQEGGHGMGTGMNDYVEGKRLP
jgi:hypothetical protein